MGVSLGLWLLLRVVVPEVLTALFILHFTVCTWWSLNLMSWRHLAHVEATHVEPVCVSVIVLPGVSVFWISTLCGFTVVTGSGVTRR